jgi:serine/threonine protein phosphatase PrpC
MFGTKRTKNCLSKSRLLMPSLMLGLIQSCLRMSFLFLPQMVIAYLCLPKQYLIYLIFSGIWDCFSSQELVDIIRYHISLGATLVQTCTFICDICIAPRLKFRGQVYPYGTDNMTIIIAAFLHGKTRAEWMESIAERVKTKSGRATPSTIRQLYSGLQLTEHPAHIKTDFSFTYPPPNAAQTPPIPP